MSDPLPTSLPDAPRAGGETPTDAAMLDLLADAAKRLREHAMRSPLDCGCNDVAERLLEFSAALPLLLERERDGERDTLRLTWVLDNGYQGIMLEPSAVRPELIAHRSYYGPYYVHSRDDIDRAMPVSAPSAERASPPSNADDSRGHKSTSPCEKCGAMEVYVSQSDADDADFTIHCYACGMHYRVDGPDA